MSVLRPALVGLVAGAAGAFLLALLGPRRRDPIDLTDPPGSSDPSGPPARRAGAASAVGSRPGPGDP